MSLNCCVQNERFEVNVCGEGGEFETLCLDSPIYSKKLELSATEHCVYFADPFAPVVGLDVQEWELADKESPRSFIGAFMQDSNFVLHLVDGGSSIDVAASAGSAPAPAADHGSSAPDSCEVAVSECASSIFLAATPSACEGASSASAGHQVLSLLTAAQVECKRLDTCLADAVFVYLQVSDMDNFKEVNEVYQGFFPCHVPPSRSCVQGGLPDGCKVQIALRVHRASHTAACAGQRSVRDALHVQSSSLWAPLCIGPYCQANTVGAEVLVAGQIPLVPHTMQMATGTLQEQVALAATNARRIMVTMGADWPSCSAIVVYFRHAALSQSGLSSKEAWAMATQTIQTHTLEGLQTTLPQGELPSFGGEMEPTELPWQLEELADGPVFDADAPAHELWQRGAYHETEFCVKRQPPLVAVVVDDLPRNAAVEFEPIGFKMNSTSLCSSSAGLNWRSSTGPAGQSAGIAWEVESSALSVGIPTHGLLRSFSTAGTDHQEQSFSKNRAHLGLHAQALVAPDGEDTTVLAVFQS